MSGSRHNPSGRGSAIAAVLLLLVIGVVIAATVLVAADAASASSGVERRRAQSRALAWSGVQAVMVELAEQREDLLDGLDPQLTPEWSLFTLDDGSRGVIRLIDLDPAGDGLAVAENAKLDINSAAAEMLSGVPGLGETLAARIVAARDERPFTSVEELLRVDGVTPDLLYGRPDNGDDGVPSGSFESGITGEGSGGDPALGGGVGRGLVDWLTVFAFDPNVQVGVADDREHRGKLRVNLNQEWSSDLEQAIGERFDSNVAQFVKQLMESGQGFGSDSELAGVVLNMGTDAEGWALVFDVFTTSDDEFLLGRLDVNRASPEVLACLPGIEQQQAEAIVERRETIDSASRAVPTWPMREGLITPDQYRDIADYVSARSMQWRVRLEVGIMPGDSAGAGFDSGQPMSMEELAASWDEGAAEERLEHRMVVEAVIDVASSRPRVAYMREVTLLEPVLAMVQAETSDRAEAALFPEDDPAALDDESLDDTDPVDVFDPSGDLDFASADTGDRSSPADGEGSGRAEAEPQPVAGSGAGAAVDRRIGRWTTRKAGGS